MLTRHQLIRDAEQGELVMEINRDISERKLAEQALMQANQRKSEFLSVLGHELRNPLAAANNAVQLLADERGDRAWALTVLKDNIRVMGHLLDDLLI
ncbi:MAG: histidine kinase dimerization/phospho-acceptor domain-containing protein [Candidatus Competibacteraceae bacterium]